jgi:ADP-ribose pyrophosphatase YjhB (NUDIX family)
MNNGEFIIRVYGIIRNEKNEVLISDEFQLGIRMTKFPGGGLHYGEGTLDCLKREFREECNGQEIVNPEHFYTTDFYQKALFYKNHQLISIYYMARLKEPICFKISEKPFDFAEMNNGNQSFRWININDLNETEITFPIDKIVSIKLKKQFGSKS